MEQTNQNYREKIKILQSNIEKKKERISKLESESQNLSISSQDYKQKYKELKKFYQQESNYFFVFSIYPCIKEQFSNFGFFYWRKK